VVQPQPTQEPIAGQPTITPQQPPTVTPTPTETPLSGTGPGGCVLNASFVADITIPDNQIEAPNAPFIKTWRIKNTGTCTWDAAYQFIFAEGNQMGGPAGVPVNVTAPGANLDVSVNLTAPAAPSATPYIGKWTLKASNSVIFGGKYTVVIVVPLPASPTPTPTATPSGAGSGPWNGHWETSYGVMDLVQTGNSVVGTYNVNGTVNGTIDGDHLHGTWVRGGTGPFDWWIGAGNLKWRGNYNGVTTWCGHRTGESDPSPCGVGTFEGDWTATCLFCNGAMHIDQDGKNFTGTYVNGTVDGTIDGNDATGQWHQSPTISGDIHWHLINRDKFQGNYGGASPWCGVRDGSGASVPSPCLWP